MWLYAATVFLGAFLLFQIELVIAKFLLPWFGGVPALWTTCMLFFQVLLVGGYAYAHGLMRCRNPRRQGNLHLVFLLVALGALAVQWLAWGAPVTPGAGWKPSDASQPTLRIMLLLAISVGLPFFVLSSTSSLMQAWFSRTHTGRSPYRLYSLSNAGSLLALLSYPFLVEPSLTLQTQAWVWTGSFAAFVLLCSACALHARRSPEDAPPPDAPPEQTPQDNPAEIKIEWRQRVPWFALPAIGSILLLATTNTISEDVAVVPFLWVLTLAVYLLSFVLCFGERRIYRRAIFVPLSVLAWGIIATVTLIFVTGRGHTFETGMIWMAVTYTVALFLCCMVCHGELYRLKPPPACLTSYYLAISVGGAIGGVFVAVAAPILFTGLWELHIGFAALAVTMQVFWRKEARQSQRSAPTRVLLGLAADAVVMATILVLVWDVVATRVGAVAVRRNFYGVLSVEQENADAPESHTYTLNCAGTVHGYQYRHRTRRRIATSYYSKTSGIGLAIENHPSRRRGQMHIGVVGLGTGTLAAYGRAGDQFRFYEINPAMVDLARHQFTFLRDSPAQIDDIVMGDARLSMERELHQGQPQRFDVLAVDAFSGDAIPVHLLTYEAFRVYLGHLQSDGILAVHISNRCFDLAPVVWRLADELDLHCVQIDRDEDLKIDAYATTWMLLSRKAALLEPPLIADSATPRPADGKALPLWTDDYSNLLRVLDASQF
jgi:hypothetical protein